jgi:hypothetical protein
VAELVVFPDVEGLVIAYLRSKLTDGTKAYTKVPAQRPNRFVKITAAGGADRNLVLSSRLVIVQCWDLDAVKASELAEWCYAILRSAQHDATAPDVRNVAIVSAPQSFPDPDTSTPRYQFTVQLDLRGHVK